MEPKLIIKNDPLDYELCDLLGEGSADFIVICANGEQVPFLGTPYDSPRQRVIYAGIMDWLNDRRRKDWPEMFENRRAEFCANYKLAPETTAKDFWPEFSFAISRTCHGYTQYLHVAIGVFEKLGSRVTSWELSLASDGASTVEIQSAGGAVFRESGRDMARIISTAAVRLLKS